MTSISEPTEIEYSLAIQLSLKDYNEEQTMLNLALAASLSEQRLELRESSEEVRSLQDILRTSAEEEESRLQRIIQEESNPSRAKSVVVTIPYPPDKEAFLRQSRYFLQRKLGVGIRILSDSQLSISARNEFTLDIATHELNELFHSGAGNSLETEMNNLKDEKIHVFVDNSNIFLSSQLIPSANGTVTRDFTVRLKAAALTGLVVNYRACQQRVVFGSKPPSNNGIWKKWRDAGFQVHAFERASNGREELIDDGILAMINETIARHKPNFNDPRTPRTLVILTGDGNSNHQRANFVNSVDLALAAGWKVELWSWKTCTSAKYLEMQKFYASSGLFSLNFLDEFRDFITFSVGSNPKDATTSGPFRARRNAKPPANIRTNLSSKQNKPRLHSSIMAAASAPLYEDSTEIVEAEEGMFEIALLEESSDEDDAPDEKDYEYMMCPISLGVFDDPVTTPYGHYFERVAIEEWITAHGDCPLTRAPLRISDLSRPSDRFLQDLVAFKASMLY